MSVFESLRVINGHVGFLGEHLSSIQDAARRKEFQFPTQSLEQVAATLGSVSGSAFARVYITAGDGPPQAPATECRVALICERRERVLPDAYALSVDTCPQSGCLENLKTGNYWQNVAALKRALQEGANETLLLNFHGKVVGCAMANIFLKIGEQWCTPALEDGVRSGVTRAWVQSQLKVVERSISREEAESASEAFLTSSWIGVMPVATFQGRTLRVESGTLALRSNLEQRHLDSAAKSEASARSKP
jgi:branched-subunit amino acid aminotransferase/4-amino-4-deoxychorismate lyase